MPSSPPPGHSAAEAGRALADEMLAASFGAGVVPERSPEMLLEAGNAFHEAQEAVRAVATWAGSGACACAGPPATTVGRGSEASGGLPEGCGG